MDIITGNFVLGDDGSRKVRIGNLQYSFVRGSGAGPSAPALPEEGLVFYLPLDQRQETAETGQAMTYRGENQYILTDGIKAAQFAGHSYGIYCTAADLPSGNFPRTISAWVYMTETGDYPYFIGYSNGDRGSNFGIGINGATEIGARLGGDYGSGTDLPLNKWSHICATHNGSTFVMYLNGAQISSTTASLNTGTKTLSIAYNAGQGDTANGFTGFLRSARIYNRVLDASEIEALANEFTPTA